MKILFISLGCDKNLADSEEMLGLLTAGGHEITDDETQADAIVINTCCFIKDAKEESVETILEMAEYKKTGSCHALIVTGCMAQRYQKEIIEEVPEVDAVLGTTSYGDIVKALEEAVAGNHFEEFRDIDYLPDTGSKRVLTTGGHFGYLKIAEGCDKHCTYCIIPKLRGKFRSVPMERLIAQAEDMAEQGVKELILVAQETTVYGKDLYGKKSLHILLKKLCEIRGIRWIRILYCYPEETLNTALMAPKQEVYLETGKKNVMSVDIPAFEYKTRTPDANDIYSYGFAFTSSDLDGAVKSLADILPDMLRLAEVEKACQLMASEIEKTRRRVNALEHVIIPEAQANIKYITMKLDENERSTQIRLMKVKDMMLEEAHHYKEREAERGA